MSLKPWYTIVTPREDIRENKSLDMAEFAVHLDHIRDGRAQRNIKCPKVFRAHVSDAKSSGFGNGAPSVGRNQRHERGF